MSAGEAKDRERDDLALLERSAAGERSAFDELVARHGAAVLRFARALTGSDAEAEEVLQRTFIDAWRGAATFTGRGDARSWLFTIARRAGARMRRRRAGEPELHDELSELGRAAGWGRDDAPLGAAIERREWVSKALERLAPADQELLVLVDVEGYSLAETATILELTVAATKSRLHRARLRLVAALRSESALDEEGR